ncbi:hypothetical protein GT352_27930 [Streptomyces sp. SID1046]|uniref:hypothetical protein n=1 Tax=Streptomyces sp. SID1046 TaxID=2690249 RepID=UPI00136CAD51|nr:hypothetical protein [Streptomyces sp. SID1046]MYV77730.1 hypothetical protein [Streptomyces sp. SID1046]
MNDILAGDPAPTNPQARKQLFHLAITGDMVAEEGAAALLDAYSAEVRTETLEEADEDLVRLEQVLRRQIEDQKAGKARWRARAEKAEGQLNTLRIQVLTEVADLLRDADETAAALLVDRLIEGGDQS